MPSPILREVGPENCADNAHGVKTEGPTEIQNLETSNCILALAGTAADGGQHGLELLEIVPRPTTQLGAEATRPRSKIRTLAVMGALFVSNHSFATTAVVSFVPSFRFKAHSGENCTSIRENMIVLCIHSSSCS